MNVTHRRSQRLRSAAATLRVVAAGLLVVAVTGGQSVAAAGQLSRPDLESQLVSTEDLPDHVVEYDRPINDGAFADSPLLNLYEETF